MFKDLAIVVHTMDKYEFCWDGWYETFKRHWNFDLGIDIYFANEIKDVNFDGIKQIKTDIGEWSDRLNRAFNMIPHKHIIYWQEDMWMLSELNNFKEYYQDFINYNMDFLMLMVKLQDRNKGYWDFEDGIIDDKYLKYGITNSRWVIFHQPAIWKKDFFLKYLQHSENPWENEVEATKRAKIDHLTNPINGYAIYDLLKWYQPVVYKGRFKQYAEEIRNGTYLK